MPDRRVFVVGGGAAGIIAAWRAAELGATVVLLEKTARLGTKILISGGGKCNLAHAGEVEDVLRAFRPNEARFLRPSMYRFTPADVIELFTSRGLEVYTRPDGRIFPLRQTAKDVIGILRSLLDRAGVDVRLESPVEGLLVEGSRVCGVRMGAQELPAEAVIVATGGSSYPKSGTTGDASPWARGLGHRIEPLLAALAPIYLAETGDCAAWSGVALRDVTLRARQDGKAVERWTGDLLFTHQGISGPCALGVSRVVSERLSRGAVTLDVDLAPDMTPEALDAQLQEITAAHPRRNPAVLAAKFMPDRMENALLARAGVNPDMALAQLERKARHRLAESIKRFELGAVRGVPLEKGEVTAGGIALDEVDPHTMRSRRADGLFLCGEALDIAGPVGGYNLQAAWSTGFVAGESAAPEAG